MSNIKKLAREIARREGKKKQVDIAQISEILGVLGDICVEDMVAMRTVVDNVVRRYRNTFQIKRTKK